MKNNLTLSLVAAALLSLGASITLAQHEPSSPGDGADFPYGSSEAECCDLTDCGDAYRAACRSCRGRDVCCSSVEEVTEKESCWKVKCEKICVPKVVCPWAEGGSGLTLFRCLQKKPGRGCCDSCGNDCGCLKPRCGEVRCVQTLDSEDYEVTRCKYQWEIRRLPPCGGKSCGCGE